MVLNWRSRSFPAPPGFSDVSSARNRKLRRVSECGIYIEYSIYIYYTGTSYTASYTAVRTTQCLCTRFSGMQFVCTFLHPVGDCRPPVIRVKTSMCQWHYNTVPVTEEPVQTGWCRRRRTPPPPWGSFQARLLDSQGGANTERFVRVYVFGKLSARCLQRWPFWHRLCCSNCCCRDIDPWDIGPGG